MKKYLISAVVAGLVVFASASSALASITWNGYVSGSWGGQFTESGYADGFDGISVQLVAGSDLEKLTPVSGLSNWSASGTKSLWSATFDTTTLSTTFKILFETPFAPTEIVYTTYLNDEALETQTVEWASNPEVAPIVSMPMRSVRTPEPATIIVWSLLGMGSWLGMRVTRRRGCIDLGSSDLGSSEAVPGRWSPEARQAIHEIIARGNRR